MAKANKGDYLSCEVCGLSLIVDEVSGYAKIDVMCCDIPMTMGKVSASRAKKKARAIIAKREETNKTQLSSQKDAPKKVKPASKK
ncbi:MAG: hypothetical protein WCJ49_08165 [Deltaproteobacteria bacterium]